MNLKQALSAFIKPALYTGPVFLGHAPLQNRCLVIRDAGSHRTNPTRFKQFPRVQIYVRDPDPVTAESTIRAIHAAMDVVGPMDLTDTYSLSHCETSGLPIPLGTDSTGLAAWTLDLLITTHTNANL